MRKLFGTDGIRGLAGEYPLQPDTMRSVGRSLVSSGYRRIVIGRDTRESGPWIEQELQTGIEAAGGDPISVGVIPTPGISFLCRNGDFHAGVVISASHNPYRDNGIKIFGPNGQKLSDSEEAALERRIETVWADHEPGLVATNSKASFNGDYLENYIRFLVRTAGKGSLAGLKVALDCAHGAAFAVAREVFERLGTKVFAIGDAPNGTNINLAAGALHPESLKELVQRRQADIGLAFDGDADRLILVDEQGVVRDGDFVLYVLGCDMAVRNELPTRTIVSTVMANLGLEVALRRKRLSLTRTQVGDRYVLAEMLDGGHELGGEQSGHTIVKSLSIAGDGILTGIQILSVMQRSQQTASELCRGLEKFPQVLLNVRVREKSDFTRIPAIQAEIEAARSCLGNDGRVLIRYSGTEPLARIMIEGPDRETIEALSNAIADRFRGELGAADAV